MQEEGEHRVVEDPSAGYGEANFDRGDLNQGYRFMDLIARIGGTFYQSTLLLSP
jgi:hypothetical protein